MFKQNSTDFRKLRCTGVKISMDPLELFEKKKIYWTSEGGKRYLRIFLKNFRFNLLSDQSSMWLTVCRAGLRTGSQVTWFPTSGKAVCPEQHTPPLWASVSESG